MNCLVYVVYVGYVGYVGTISTIMSVIKIKYVKIHAAMHNYLDIFDRDPYCPYGAHGSAASGSLFGRNLPIWGFYLLPFDAVHGYTWVDAVMNVPLPPVPSLQALL